MSKECCFIGHRKIEETSNLEKRLFNEVERLIHYGVDTFLFGSKSQFNILCHKVVSELKEKYPHIKRIYIRAEFPNISRVYKDYLLESYEETYYPESIRSSGRAAYAERNQIMIDRSLVCIFYYDEEYLPPKRKDSRGNLTFYQPKSGTKIAYEYAIGKKKKIINVI